MDASHQRSLTKDFVIFKRTYLLFSGWCCIAGRKLASVDLVLDHLQLPFELVIIRIQVTQVLVITYTNIVNLLIQILVLLLRLISFHFGFLVVKFPGEKSIVNLLQIKRASYIVHDASVNVLEGLNIISLPLFEIAISRNSGWLLRDFYYGGVRFLLLNWRLIQILRRNLLVLFFISRVFRGGTFDVNIL